MKQRRTYTPAKTANYESQIKFHAQCVCQRPLEKALEVEIKFNFLKAKSSKLTHVTKRPDIDNLSKAILDSLNGVAFLDDAQIVKLTLEKNFSDRDSLEITIHELD